MTHPLHGESGYLQEVTLCLSQSIVHLLQTRPDDPIEFLALALKNHRRLHPRPTTQGTESHNNIHTDNATAVTSPDLGVAATEQAVQEVQPGQQPARHGIVRQDDKNDEGIDECHQSQRQLDHVVHRDFVMDIVAVGDLFDDDDFG